jgi:hypothetical protein
MDRSGYIFSMLIEQTACQLILSILSGAVYLDVVTPSACHVTDCSLSLECVLLLHSQP